MANNYLPIGSVVLLKNSKKRVMIVGLKQKQVDSGKMWDYSGCLYPEGVLNPERLYLFNSDQIARVFFIGFQDGEYFQLLKYLKKLDAEEAEKKEEN